MFLETERLILRKFEERDFNDFCEYAMDSQMCLMMGRDEMADIKAARLNFDWLKNKEERGYAIVYKESGKVIGNLTITEVSAQLKKCHELKEKKGCSMSFSISREFQRKGLMYETLCSVIDELFCKENMDYLNCGYFNFNTASENLQKKLGFSHFKTEQMLHKGRNVIVIETILWREAFFRKKEQYGKSGSAA